VDRLVRPHILVPESKWREMRRLCDYARLTVTRASEVGFRLLLVLAKRGELPKEVEEMVRSDDPDIATDLKRLVEAGRELRKEMRGRR